MPAHELWLGTPRNVIKERGFGITHTPGAVAGRLGGTFAIDPLTGFACAPVVASMADPLAWSPMIGSVDEYLECQPWVLSDGSPGVGLAHRGTGVFQVRSTNLGEQDGCFFGFVAYAAGAPFDLWRGAWAIRFLDGLVQVWRSGVKWLEARLWDAEEWVRQPHICYVYAVGRRMAIRRVGPGRNLGILTPRSLIDTTEVALPAGPLTLRGTGYLAWAVAPERHMEQIVVEHDTIRLPEESTQPPTSMAWHLGPVSDTQLALLTEEGDLLPDEGPYNAFRYRFQAIVPATGQNVYLTRVRASFPKRIESDELVPVDLLNLDDVRVWSVDERRSLEPGGAGLDFEVGALPGTLSPHVKPNMRGSWRPFGTQRADFFTSRPERQQPHGYEVIRFDCETGWKRLMHAQWSGEGSFGGQRLSDVYAAVAARAGLTEADMVISAGAFELPEEEDDGPPLFDFQPGQSIADVLTYLRDQFDATALMRFKADGRLYIEPMPSEPSGVVFRWDRDDLLGAAHRTEMEVIAAGTSTYPVILGDSWHERFDETGFANEVVVIGQDADGVPLVAVATDWPSINDPEAVNYIGEFRRMVIVDAGLATQGLVNAVCRAVLERVRLLALTANCRAIFLPSLWEGDIIEIDGRGLWRITALQNTWDKDGPQGLGTYELIYFGPVEA